MRIGAMLALCAVVVLGACSSGPIGSSRKLGGAEPVSICDRGHFQDFLDRFSEDVQVQRTHTAFPLHKREFRHVTTQIEPLPVESVLKESQVRFPVYPSPSQLHEQSLTAEVSAENGKTTEVRVSRADTDYLVVYSFEHDRCWKLTRVEDRSL